MTEKDAVQLMKNNARDNSGDPEEMHREVDDILLAFLMANGFEGLVGAYEDIMIGFWYA